MHFDAVLLFAVCVPVMFIIVAKKLLNVSGAELKCRQ